MYASRHICNAISTPMTMYDYITAHYLLLLWYTAIVVASSTMNIMHSLKWELSVPKARSWAVLLSINVFVLLQYTAVVVANSLPYILYYRHVSVNQAKSTGFSSQVCWSKLSLSEVIMLTMTCLLFIWHCCITIYYKTWWLYFVIIQWQ
jgi:hypothetical protein